MLQGHEFITPIQYGYLILAGILILIACIAGIIYIIRDIQASATDAPDYIAHWERLKTDKKTYYEPPFSEWIRSQMVKETLEEVSKEIEQELMRRAAEITDEMARNYTLTIPQENIAEGQSYDPPSKVEITYITPTQDKDHSNELIIHNPTDVFILRHSDVIMPGPGSGSEKRNADKIYQTLTKPPFHWETFLDDLIKDCCTPGQIDRDKVLSAHFQTCPCGQLDPAIPRREDGEPGQPEDEELCMLGAEFWQALCMDDYFRASDVYRQIKARETHLLNLNQSIS